MPNEYESAFEGDSEVEERRRRRLDLTQKLRPERESRPDGGFFSEARAKHEGRVRRLHYLSLNAYDRHKELVNQYHLYHPGATRALQRDASRDRTDHHVLRDNHRFVWAPEDTTETWERRMAKRYYDKLFREYCICDLAYYKLNRVAMRWRVEKEVVEGKGQFSCGAKRCEARDSLQSWEVNFAYEEHGEKKACLVKLRLCPDCSRKLNYHNKRRKAKPPKKMRRKSEKRARTEGKSESERVPGSGVDGEGSSGAGGSGAGGSGGSGGAAAAPQGEDIWKQPATVEEEKSRTEEFDELLSELFM